MGPFQQGLTRALLCSILLIEPVFALPNRPLLPRASSSASVATASASTCNGRAEYCNRSYSNITFVGSHDAPFVGKLPQQNQNIEITAQLDMGIRFLQAQTHHSIIDKVLELCHTSCWLEDAGKLESFLSTVKEWMDKNPNEVVTLLLTNGDSLGVDKFGDAFSKSGLDKYAFEPSSDSLSLKDWPTLGKLISSEKRLVVFLGESCMNFINISFLPCIQTDINIDYGADTSSVKYILDEFKYYFETPYDVTDKTFKDCSIDRPSGASADGRMYIVNHFLDVDVFGADVPDRGAADDTNAATGNGSIGAQASECAALYKRAPNAVLADFVDKGEVIKAQDQLNGF